MQFAESSPALTAAARVFLTPYATEAHYATTTTWETFVNGDYQCTTIEKEVTLGLQPEETGYAVDFRTAPPVLTTPADPEPLAELALRLAALYAQVRVRVAPTGAVEALLNHAELQRTGEHLLTEMRAGALADDRLTPTLADFLSRQLQSPANVLQSLHHDYLYQTLLPNFYQLPLAGATVPGRGRQFSSFFNKVPLYFAEQVRVLPEATPDYLSLGLHGTLDTQQTDLPAVRELLAKLLQPDSAAGQAGAALPAPHFHYEATYRLARATGLPVSVELTVYARVGEVFNQQYTLSIHRL